MKVIHKYSLSIKTEQIIEMPKGAEILTVQVQYNEAQLWALVDPKAETESITFRLLGTGEKLSDDFNEKYIGIYQMYNGTLVLHLFKM